ncbi:uncharacterized protein LOC143301317 [Babylonia areolata]|uniref:uncharacterized protein LOC143301317 n=1 Tax=Babylonia areolata TaxID=304850 RepID=UPI003FD0D17E
MRLSLCVLVVLCAVLVANTEAGWVKDTFKKIRNKGKDLLKKKGVETVVDVIKKYGPGIIGRIGKRSADFPRPALSPEDKEELARGLVQQLDKACPQLFSSEGGMVRLTTNLMDTAFMESDANKDGSLDGKELDLFENTLDAVQHCLQMLRVQGK